MLVEDTRNPERQPNLFKKRYEKYKRHKERQRVRDRDLSWGGNGEGGEVSTQ